MFKKKKAVRMDAQTSPPPIEGEVTADVQYPKWLHVGGPR